jgi:hypothetical protein
MSGTGPWPVGPPRVQAEAMLNTPTAPEGRVRELLSLGVGVGSPGVA